MGCSNSRYVRFYKAFFVYRTEGFAKNAAACIFQLKVKECVKENVLDVR